MEIDIERPGGLARNLRIRLPAERVAAEKNARLKRMARNYQVPGFRKGHAPKALIEREYGAAAEDSALRRLISDSLAQALKEQALRPAAQPQIVDSRMAPDGGIEFTAHFEIMPEIKLVPLESLTVEQAICELSEADLELAMRLLLQQHVQLAPVQRCATTEDWVVAREATAAESPEREAAALQFDLANPSLPQEFKTALVGALAGDRVAVRQNDISSASSRTVELEVLQVLRAERPAPDDDFAKRLGIADVHTFEQLQQQLDTDLKRRGTWLARRHTRHTVLEALHKAHQQHLAEVPECLVQQKLQNARQAQPEDEAADARESESLRQYARRSVELELLLSAWIRHLGLKPETARVRRAIEQAIATAPDPKAARKSLRSAPGMRVRFESAALEEQLVEKVLASAHVERKNYTYTQLHQSLPGT